MAGAPLDADIEPDRTVLAACSKIRDVLEEHRQIPAELMPSLASTEAMRLVLRQVDGETIPPPPDHGAIEMLGWLELPLDDAPALVVTGLNEGSVPASLNSDLFLPNQLRRALGIEDNDRRYARDAYALSVLAASREKLRLIAGRRSADGDPLLPSRLLFACDDPTMARRVMAFFSAKRTPDGASPLAEGRRSHRFADKATAARAGAVRLEVPRPKRLSAPITSMRVTEFKDYLGCPYRYYLRHVLELEGLDDSADELDGGRVRLACPRGAQRAGKGPRRGRRARPTAIAKYLDAQLDAAVLGALRQDAAAVDPRAGRAASAAAGCLGPLAGRLGGPRLADRARRGQPGRQARLRWWSTASRCSSAAASTASTCTSRPGKRMIFDYKTSDPAKTPEKAHRKKSGEWIDLQLPLYRHLVAGLGIEGPVELAYINLPKDISRRGAPAGRVDAGRISTTPTVRRRRSFAG